MKKDKSNHEHIRRHIAQLRTANHMTQEEFAEFVGLSPRTISFIETGRKNAGLESLLKITKAFGITLDALVSENHLAEPTQDGSQFLRLAAECDTRECQILYATMLCLKTSLRTTPHPV